MLANKEYKDSGVSWLGNIPALWNIVKTKRHFQNEKRVAGKYANQYERLALTMNGVIKRDKEDAEGLQPESFEGYQVLEQNQLVFKLIDLENVKTSRVGLSPYTGIVSPAYIILHNDQQDNRFYYYYYMNMYYQEIFNYLGGEGVRSALNAKDLLETPIPDISLKQQKVIADYLDKECARIDDIVEKQRNIIEKLKEYKKSVITEAVTKGLNPNAEMKDSGIEWVGDVPADWEVRKMKTLGVFSSSGIDKTLNPDEPIVRIINYTDVYGNGTYILTEKKYMVVSAPAQKIKENLVEKGDLIFTPSSETIEDIGLSALVDVDLENTAFSYHVLRFVFNEKFDHRYKKYLCNNHFVLNWFSSHAKGTIRQTLSRDIFKSCLVFVPPLSEQSAIADYLDQKCTEIDSVIEKREKMIDLLTEYKKSLIYECVTGKKEVA